MEQLREDVQKFYGWAQKEFEGEEIDRLLFEVQSSITNLERYINNEFRRKKQDFSQRNCNSEIGSVFKEL